MLLSIQNFRGFYVLILPPNFPWRFRRFFFVLGAEIKLVSQKSGKIYVHGGGGRR